MADTRFFKKAKNFTVSEIIEISGADTVNDKHLSVVIEDVAPLHTADKKHLSFLDNIKYKDDFKVTGAGACFVTQEMAQYAPDDVICLISSTPYKAYALTAQAFYPEIPREKNIASTAVIEDSAQIGEGAYIAHNVYIGHNVIIGKNAWIDANASIQDNVTAGDNFRVGSNATISHSVVANDVRLYPGARVGQDGFGFAIDPAGHVKVPQLGRVIIGNHVEIGANTTIDRGAGPDTVIGDGAWIDNLVQIGHNVEIGRGCVIVAQVGISGSTKIGDYVAIGGQTGIAGHLNIGVGVRLGAQTGVMTDIPAGAEYLGSPAVPKSQFFRQVAALKRLIKVKKSS